MKDSLATYLHDHLAGATFAVELLEALRDQHSTAPLGQFAADLLREVEGDRAVLQELADRLNAGSSTLKNAVSWLSEKASRLKLRRQAESDLGTFESLEALALGILGKEALWTTLNKLGDDHVGLRHLDYPQLIASARAQHAKVEAWRIACAVTALGSAEN